MSVSELHVTFGIAERDIAVDFRVAAGSTTAIIGPNGAGKSTCFEVISGLLRPDWGVVQLGDRVLTRISAGRRSASAHADQGMQGSGRASDAPSAGASDRHGLGHEPTSPSPGSSAAQADTADANLRGTSGAESGVTGKRAWVPSHKRGVVQLAQTPLLFPTMTVGDNAAFGLRAARVARAEANSRALAMLDRVDAAQFVDRMPSALSGGQAQRAAIARALVTHPPLLLLDEPMAALDWDSAAAIRQLLASLLQDETALLISHDAHDVVAIADHVIVLEGGGVLQQGTVAEVFEHPASDFVRRFTSPS